jgi:chorismate-pyruvate lyase
MATNDGRHESAVRAADLVRLFHEPAEFGSIRGVLAAEVPQPARGLLDHRSHMTVAMENHHGGEVRLRVLATVERPPAGVNSSVYAREILLENQAGKVVQQGIVRIDLDQVAPATAADIRAAKRPLGRILIEAGMLRDVHDVRLVEIVPGPHLTAVFGLESGRKLGGKQPQTLFGRVADIELDGRPAVELLEIVAPA